MARNTPPPQVDLSSVMPELAEVTRMAVRLHPRPGEVPELAASKIGGVFLWPSNEPWPTCEVINDPPPWWEPTDWPIPEEDDDVVQVPLFPVLQLNSRDFPEVEFPPESDLFQLFWWPVGEDYPYRDTPHFIWRNSAHVTNPLTVPPEWKYFRPSSMVRSCVLHLERVAELPWIGALSRDMEEAVKKHLAGPGDVDDDALYAAGDFYEAQLSVCPGTKVGGFVHWIQNPEKPICKRGHAMEHLLTLAANEFDAESRHRWCPVEDTGVWKAEPDVWRAVQRAAFPRMDGYQFVFVCRQCDGWPIRSIFQC